VSQREHLPCSADLSCWVISRCGFVMHHVPSSGCARFVPVTLHLTQLKFFWIVDLVFA